jgi:hypothetical protein
MTLQDFANLYQLQLRHDPAGDNIPGSRGSNIYATAEQLAVTYGHGQLTCGGLQEPSLDGPGWSFARTTTNPVRRHSIQPIPSTCGLY